MYKKFLFSILLTITIMFISYSVFAKERTKINEEEVWNVIDKSSISDDYKIESATNNSNNFRQIIFIHKDNKQKMFLGFSPNLLSKKKEQFYDFFARYKDILLNSINKMEKAEVKNMEEKSFIINKQKIPYYLMDIYKNGKLETKHMVGFIPDYEGYFITIQSYGTPEKYNQKMAENFFSNVKLKCENFETSLDQ